MLKSSVTIVIFLLIFVNLNSILSIPIEEKSLLHRNSIDEYILDEMESKHIPGLSASIAIGDSIIWKGAYGYANIENNKIVKNETLFKIASVSKTVTATALMQLIEDGLLNLDDPINDYLSFDVVHPLYPSDEITFHMLLTHSSGIKDNWEYLFHFVGDSPIAFQTFLEQYLVPGGEYYDSDNNFYSWQTGTSWGYTNIGVALVGYLIEKISNMNFTDYTEYNLFNPLNMNESGWYLRDLNISNIAMPYHWDGEEYIPYGHIGWVDVPAGDLRTSASQLLNFLIMFINNGTFNYQIILDNETVELMLTPQLPFNQMIGLIWWKSIIGGRTVWGHGGSDYGARALMQFDPSTQIGVVILINGEVHLNSIADKLFDYAEEIINNSPPYKPEKPKGSTQGKVNQKYNYSTKTTDSDNDEIYYIWDWGDETYSDWLGPYLSGEQCNTSYTWDKEGEYKIRVKAKDSFGAESNWSDPFIITMPKCKSYKNKFIDITESYPLLQIIFKIFTRFSNNCL